jgi:hypothetical protein
VLPVGVSVKVFVDDMVLNQSMSASRVDKQAIDWRREARMCVEYDCEFGSYVSCT